MKDRVKAGFFLLVMLALFLAVSWLGGCSSTATGIQQDIHRMTAPPE